MVAIKDLVFFAATAAAAVLPRQAVTVQTDLTAIDNAVNQLGRDVTLGPLNAGTLLLNVDSLESALNTGIQDAQASPAIIGQAAAGIVDFLTTTAQQDIATALSNLEGARAIFIAALLDPVILNDLGALRKLARQYYSALQTALPLNYNDIETVANNTDEAFIRAIALFDLSS